MLAKVITDLQFYMSRARDRQSLSQDFDVKKSTLKFVRSLFHNASKTKETEFLYEISEMKFVTETCQEENTRGPYKQCDCYCRKNIASNVYI